jgi:penicillin-binding protein 1A
MGTFISKVREGIPSSEVIIAAMAAGNASPSVVYDRNGRKIGEFIRERRFDVPLAQIPKHVRDAFLSAEDSDFYRHHGVSPKAVLRAAWHNLRHWRDSSAPGPTQGGSTITQQLARMRFLDRDKTFVRKTREAWIARVMERHISKDKILETYLNEIFLGNESWGVEAASRNYFRKSVRDLNLAEAAMLAGLPKAPSRLAPNRHWVPAKRRQTAVLERMVEERRITDLQALRSRSQRILVHSRPENPYANAPYFMDEVRRELSRRFALNDLGREGLRITTTLDMTLQNTAAKQLMSSRRDAGTARGGAILMVDAPTGAIVAMQGGSSFQRSQWNRATRTRRPIGDLVQPVVTALALESGLSLASVYNGGTRLGASPRDEYLLDSLPSLYEALLAGEQQRFVELGNALGLGSVADFSTQLGFSSVLEPWSWIAGSGSATLPEIAQAFVALTHEGAVVNPWIIERIKDRRGESVYQRPTNHAMNVLSRETAFIMRQVMKDTIKQAAPSKRGVERHADLSAFGIRSASPSLHDSWAVAGSGRLLTVGWIGAEARSPRLANTPDEVRAIAWPMVASLMERVPDRWRSGEEPAPARIGYVRIIPKIRLAGGVPVRPKSVPALAGREP